MSKYEPLADHLSSVASERVTLRFAAIERIIGKPLPPSARSHNAWWANNPTGHSHCKAWHDAGWRTERLDLSGETVDFVRDATAGARTQEKPRVFGALGNTVTIHDAESVTSPSGIEWRADEGRL